MKTRPKALPQHDPERDDAELALGREVCTDAESALRREWLVTNGIGGFASGTIAGVNTRRYHGLLCAALEPPVGRTMLVAGLDAVATCEGARVELAAHEYGGGVLHPRGYRHLAGFRLESGIPTWHYAWADVRLSRRTWMDHGANRTWVQYCLDDAAAPVELALRPLCTHRDYHAHALGRWDLRASAVADGFVLEAWPGARPYRVLCPGAEVRPDADWYWNFLHRVEAERGLDSREDLFSPGTFVVRLQPGETVAVACTAEAGELAPAGGALARERARRTGLPGRAPAGSPGWIRALTGAADAFLVQRPVTGGTGTSVIAGYPWFTDWGRDTMIALPGLTVAAGRPELAAPVLRTFAGHVSQGMLPNRFPDGGDAPEYNTVDATLWYFQAVLACVEATGDDALARELYPLLRDIVQWHQRGTRYGIHVDAADGLLAAGEPGVQLTWMDARVGDRVITPRSGKPVEVNALWINALAAMAALAARLGDEVGARHFRSLQDTTTAAFRRRFWNPSAGCLFDVVDGPEGEPDAAGRRCDGSVRPNQLFAVSLPATIVTPDVGRAIVDTCTRELLTPVGLRSLAPSDPRYVGRYAGGPGERDAAYHQGTVWSWLLGPFALAHHRVHGDAARARAWLAPMADHLREGCIGSVSEIFDGDAPHEPRGCFAQAWGVAEVLRAWRQLGDAGN